MTSQTNSNSFSIVNVPDVHLRLRGHEETGTLSLECVDTTALSATPQQAGLTEDTNNRSVYLVLHLNEHAFPLEPVTPINLIIYQDGRRAYSFNFNNAPVTLTIPGSFPHTLTRNVAEDIENFDHILTQYADFRWESQGSALPDNDESAVPTYEAGPAPATRVEEGKRVPNPELRGTLVLMDEASGEVVAEVPERLGVSIKEDPSVSGASRDGASAGPVVLELPPDVYDVYTGAKDAKDVREEDLLEAREIFVTAIPPEEQDWITKSANLVSYAISTSTSLLATGLTTASKYYIGHSKAYTPPASSPTSTPGVTTPPTPHPYLSRAHAWTSQAARASARTGELVEGIIRSAVGNKNAPSSNKPSSLHQSPTSTPPRISSPGYKVYTPKSRATTPAGLAPPLPPRTLSAGGSRSPAGSRPTSPRPKTTQPEQPHKPLKTTHKIALSANLVLATIDDSANRLFEAGSQNLSAVVGHKYGPQAGHNTHSATQTAKNVTLVYIDMKGFARKALIRKAGTEWVKGRVGSPKTSPAVAGKSS